MKGKKCEHIVNIFKYMGMKKIVKAMMESGFYLTMPLKERRDLAKRHFISLFGINEK